MRICVGVRRFAVLAATLPVLAWADGLTVSTSSGVGSFRWQARLEVDRAPVRAELGPSGLGVQVWHSARLFSEYRLDALKFGQTSGLKLTSGLLLTQREGYPAVDGASRTAWPYLGLGYSGGSDQGGWGFNADVGMAAQSLGATVRLGRMFGGGLSVSDALRELRLQPVVRLGMTYSF